MRGRRAWTAAATLLLLSCVESISVPFPEGVPGPRAIIAIRGEGGVSVRVLSVDGLQAGLQFSGEASSGEVALLSYASVPATDGPLSPVTDLDASAGPLPAPDRAWIATARGDWQWQEGAPPAWLLGLRFAELAQGRCPTLREQRRVDLAVPEVEGVGALLDLEDGTVLVAARMSGGRSELLLLDAELAIRAVSPPLTPEISSLGRVGSEIWFSDVEGGLRSFDPVRLTVGPFAPVELGPRTAWITRSPLGLLASSRCGCMAELAAGEAEWRPVAVPPGACVDVAELCNDWPVAVATTTLATTLTVGFRDTHQAEVRRLDRGQATFECVDAQPLAVATLTTVVRLLDGTAVVIGSTLNGTRMRFSETLGAACRWGRGREVPNLLFVEVLQVLPLPDGSLVYSAQRSRMGVLPPDQDCEGLTLSGGVDDLNAIAPFPADQDGASRFVVGSATAGSMWLVRLE